MLIKKIYNSANLTFCFFSFIALLLIYSLFFTEEFFSIDDAFYYYSISVNSDSFFKTSYDGYTYTNGYQPLWMAFSFILYKFLLFFELEAFFLNLILFVNIIFLLGFLYVFRQLLIDFKVKVPNDSSKLYLFMILSPLIFIHPGINIFLIFGGGIEFQMTLLLFSLWMREAFKFEGLSIVYFTLITILLILARLDSAVILAPYFIYFSLYKRKNKVFISGFLVFLVISMWLIFNHITYNSLMPISGEIKSLWGNYDTNAGSVVDRIKDTIFQWLPISRIIFNDEYFIPIIRIVKTLIIFSLFTYLLWNIYIKRDFRLELHRMMNKFEGFLYILLFGFLLFVAYLSSHLFTETKFWYYSFFYILLGILLANIVFSSTKFFLIRKIFIFYSMLTLIEFGYQAIDIPVTKEYSQKRSILLEVESLAEGKRLATPNSGVYGWYSNNTVSNMDGLVSDKEYYSQLENNAIARYWNENDTVIFINKIYLEKWPYKLIETEFDCLRLSTDQKMLFCKAN